MRKIQQPHNLLGLIAYLLEIVDFIRTTHKHTHAQYINWPYAKIEIKQKQKTKQNMPKNIS